MTIPFAKVCNESGRTSIVGRADKCSAAVGAAVENALDADGERLAGKVGKSDWRIEGRLAIVGCYSNDGRRRWWRLRRRRRVDLHGDERFFMY